MPPLMYNHHCYIGSLGDVCRWLGPKAEALGVEIYPGFAAAEVLYDDNGAVRGIATGDMGIARDGSLKDSFTRGMELLGKYTLFAEGARGSLSKQLIAKYSLDAKSMPVVLAEPVEEDRHAHVAAFFDCIRTGAKSPADITVAATAALTAILGREAIYRKQVLTWESLGVRI